MTEPDDDLDLWERVRADDADAFGLLFERHGPRIHGYVLRRTGDPGAAEEVVAITFLEAWRRRHAITLLGSSAAPWLYGVAANTLRNRARAGRRHRAALEQLGGLRPPSPALVERQAEAAAEAAVVLERIRHLHRRERDVLVLAVWEGLDHAEIAVALDISVGTVKSRLSRARTRLDPARHRPPASASPIPATPTILSPKES